jgi:hypothetical protein
LNGPVVIANNAFYATPAGFALRVPHNRSVLQDITLAGNAGTGPIDGLPRTIEHGAWNPRGHLERDLDENLYPRGNSTLVNAANPRFLTPHDFNQFSRAETRTGGAYVFNPATNAPWKITPGFKTIR